jgi:hypothetical protein
LEREARLLVQHPAFKGYIHDVGGPTANFRSAPCAKHDTSGACTDRDCLGATPCPHLKADHADYLALLRRLRAVPGVKKVFVRSGIRFDYLLSDPSHSEFLRELCAHHVSGQLKVAPEHVSDGVLRLARKSCHAAYVDFAKEYAACNKALGKKQYLVPYFIASLPGATLTDADTPAGRTLTVTGPARLAGADLDLHDISEFTPVVAALAAAAAGPSVIRGVGHIRGHETNRLAALEAELASLGANVRQSDDGLQLSPAALHSGVFHTWADHRMAHAGALIGLVAPGVVLDDVSCTTKTLPDFPELWTHLVEPAA